MALKLVDKHQARAETIADEIQPEDLRRLMYFLIDSILERPEERIQQLVPATIENADLGTS